MLFTMRRKKSLFFGLYGMLLIIQPSYADVLKPVTIEESLAAGLQSVKFYCCIPTSLCCC